MKNQTAVFLMALGLVLPVTTFGENTDAAPAPANKPSNHHKMATDEARQSKPASQRQPSTPRIIALIDVNHDRVLDTDEIAKASELLRALDKNGDGTLTIEELRPQRSSKPRPMPALAAERGAADAPAHPPVRARLGVVDANRDGVIDATEISAASQVLSKLDKDSNGKVTVEEARAQRASRTSARASTQ